MLFLLSLFCVIIFGKRYKFGSLFCSIFLSFFVSLVAMFLTNFYVDDFVTLIIFGLAFLVVNLLVAKIFSVWSSLANLLYSSLIYSFVSLFLYAVIFLITSFSLVEGIILIILLILFVAEALLCLAEVFTQMNSLFRIRNIRISKPWDKPLKRYPKVSIHIPTKKEPPEMVIETLAGLERLNYPNFEVIVVDNGTEEEALWRPVEKYCKEKSEKFKFFHVGELSGFKAGALNLALKHTASDSEIICVIDADYLVVPEFLKETVGYFEDEKIAIVQTPQSFRGWEWSKYFVSCFWVYRYFFAVNMISNNMDNAASFMGTMGLFRKNILETIGEWSEKTITEDIEVGFRVHSKGYKTVYIDKAFGKGFIPDEFKSYKKQRERWTFGNVQVLKQHWKKFLPGVKSGLNFWQKVNYFAAISIWMNLLLPVTIILLILVILYNFGMAFSWPILFVIMFTIGSYIFRRTFGFLYILKNLIKQKFSTMFWALVSFYSLTLAMAYATLDGFITKQFVFKRTSKFTHRPKIRDNWKYAFKELAITLICLFFAISIVVVIGGFESWLIAVLLIIYALIFSTTSYNFVLNVLEQGKEHKL
jgi:cellulose synthase/poly-beta-1,6-N-acetylglucosamine synthase-like glycosyltransferase